jgi:uncharacterized protein (TIGR01777 family)
MSGEVLLSGATGLIGSRLAERLRQQGRGLRLLSRSPERLAATGRDRAIGWDALRVEPEWLAGAEAVVHLAGEPLFGGAPSAARRERVWRSRIDSTRSLVDALGRLAPAERPRALVCASAVGIYGDHGDAEIDESTPPGTGFLAELCRDWEAEAARAAAHGVRCCSLRIGVVLARGGGALAGLLPLFRLGLGARIASGRQWFPWIHLEDCVACVELALQSDGARGPWNVAAPGSVTNAQFSRALARALHRPAFLAVPAFAVRAALGPLASELLSSRRVAPAAATRAGLAFRFPELEPALSDLVAPP